MVAYASRGAWLRAGDVVGSGTCGTGCILELALVHGPERFPWLAPGDVVIALRRAPRFDHEPRRRRPDDSARLARCLAPSDLQVAAAILRPLDRLEQGLEVALAEARAHRSAG